MVQKQHINQDNVNTVWRNVWGSHRPSAKEEFKNRLFIEAYRVMGAFVPRDTKHFLEIGTGSGRYAVAFARDLPYANIRATDIVVESLAAAKSLAEDIHVNNVSFELQNVEALTYANDSFDVVFCDTVIQHVPHAERALAEIARVVRPGGVAIIAVVNQWSIHALIRFVQHLCGYTNEYGEEIFYSRRSLRALVAATGLEELHLTGFYPAYGIYRLKQHHRAYEVAGKILNRLTRHIDQVTGGFASSRFGFEIVIVGRKSLGTLGRSR